MSTLAQYKTAITEGTGNFFDKYELPVEYQEELVKMLLTAGAKNMKQVDSSAVSGNTAKPKRKHTSYNLYIQKMFADSKENDPRNSQSKMSEFSKNWKQLSQEEKQQYEDIAKEQNNTVSETVKGTGPKRPLTGYNLYYRENKDSIKVLCEGTGDKFMKTVGASWKALSAEERKSYSDRAKTVSPSAEVHEPADE